MRILTRSYLLALLGAAALAGCKKEVQTPYSTAATAGYASIGVPGAPALATKYAPGETVPLVLGYNQADNPTTITVFQATKTDSSQTVSLPVGGTLSATAGLSTQLVPYTVPAGYPLGTVVRVDVRLNFPDGGQRLRTFSYTVARSPTLVGGATPVTYRNGLAANAQVEGDVVGYGLSLNAGGISTVPAGASLPVANLFKAVDSLVYYARTGTSGALQRQGVVRSPTAGVANTRTVDVTIPAGSAAAGGVTFVFTAFAQTTSTTLTSALLPVAGAATALPTTRRGTVSFGAGSAPDSLAFNLNTGLNEPAANATTGKDLLVSGLASTGVLTLSAPNTTRYYKLTTAQLNTLPYATATANAVGLLTYQNTPGTDLGTPAVGDVYAVRVRGTAPALLRITGLRASTNGSVGRVKFEYRSL